MCRWQCQYEGEGTDMACLHCQSSYCNLCHVGEAGPLVKKGVYFFCPSCNKNPRQVSISERPPSTFQNSAYRPSSALDPERNRPREKPVHPSKAVVSSPGKRSGIKEVAPKPTTVPKGFALNTEKRSKSRQGHSSTNGDDGEEEKVATKETAGMSEETKKHLREQAAKYDRKIAAISKRHEAALEIAKKEATDEKRKADTAQRELELVRKENRALRKEKAQSKKAEEAEKATEEDSLKKQNEAATEREEEKAKQEAKGAAVKSAKTGKKKEDPRVATLKKDLEELKEELATAEAKVTEFGNENLDLKRQVDTLQKELASMKESKESAPSEKRKDNHMFASGGDT